MTKDQERKVLDQIVKLIESTGPDSYIAMASARVPEYAKRNIDDDAAYNPVDERDSWENKFHALEITTTEEFRKNESKYAKQLTKMEHDIDALEQNMRITKDDLDTSRDIIEKQSKTIAELRDERDAMADSVNGLQEIIDEMEAEMTILRLKAENYDLRKKLEERDQK